jgi:copper chaperone CopZ
MFLNRLDSLSCNHEMTEITNSIINTNQRMDVHIPLKISEVGSGAMEEEASPATGRTRCAPHIKRKSQ